MIPCCWLQAPGSKEEMLNILGQLEELAEISRRKPTDKI
jgi:hypothetical protein